jgi:hypothetical protein
MAKSQQPAARPKRALIDIDEAIRRALELLGWDRMRDMQDLAYEAFRDLKKHWRPVTLKEQLKESTQSPASDER